MDSGSALRRRTLLKLLAALPMAGALPLLDGCARPVSSTKGQAEGWLPAPAARPGSLLVIDLNGVALDTQVALAVLQGVVNARLSPGGQGLYVLLPSNYVGGVAFQGSDQRWLSIYAEAYGLKSTTGAPQQAVLAARKAGIKQYVIWDPNVPATINVANTLAWLHGVLAVAPSDATSPLQGPLALASGSLNLSGQGFQLLVDLRTKNFANADAAYQWMLGQLGKTVPEALALVSVGDLPSDPTEGVIRWTPRDYAVVARAFCWIGDLTSSVTPPSTLADLYQLVSGRKTTAFGWTNSETDQTILCSSHGVNFVGADTPGLSAENLSVHSAIATTATQKPRPAAPTLDANGVYAAIIITDGDNISVLIDFHEGRWVEPQRGQVPVGWSMQSMSATWTPGIARYYFDSATDNDEMIAWLPFGYPDLASFVGKPNWDAYVTSAQTAMHAANLRVGQDLPHEDYVMNAHTSGLWDLMHGNQPPDGMLLGYTSNIGYPSGQAMWINGRPVFAMGGFGGGSGSTQAEQAESDISGLLQAVSHRPLFVVVGLDNGSQYTDALSIVQTTYAEKVQFLLPGQLVDLAREAWAKGLSRAAPLGTPASYGVRDTYFLLSAGDDGSGSSASTYQRAGVASELRQAQQGGLWTYAFNVEGCKQASAEVVLTGAGSVEVGTDGVHWRAAGSTSQSWGEFSVFTLDLSTLLPAEHIYLRFQAAETAIFAALDLNLWYNRVLTGAALPAAVRSATSSELGMIVAEANAGSVSLVLGTSNAVGLVQVGAHQGDSDFHSATVGGESAAVFDTNTASPGSADTYLYFTANVPGWTFPRTLYLTVQYYDQPSGGTLQAEYDTTGTGLASAYASAGASLELGGTASWKTYTWTLSNADFTGQQNYDADFRLAGTVGVAVHAITLSLAPPT